MQALNVGRNLVPLIKEVGTQTRINVGDTIIAQCDVNTKRDFAHEGKKNSVKDFL